MGTQPNTSLVLSEAELSYIDEQWEGRKSAAIHAALRVLMGADRDYYVAKTPYFYPSVHGPFQQELVTVDGKVRIFTLFEAQAYIKEMERGVYLLEDGEYARPAFQIVCQHDLPEDCISDYLPREDFPFYREIPAEEVPEAAMKQLATYSLEWYHPENEYDVYMANAHVDGVTYAVVYRLRCIISQLHHEKHGDDLSEIDWEYPTYYIGIDG